MDKSYNLGLTDVTAALLWISRNIERFGGDPSLVTLLGWGAGADVVTALTATRPPKGHPFLFTQAWVSHNTVFKVSDVGEYVPPNRTTGYKAGYELWANSPCNRNQSSYDPLCLMALPARDIVNSVPRHWLTSGRNWLEPDNFVFRQPASTVWAKGTPPNDFPLVLGSTIHGAADTLYDCRTIESKAEDDVKKLLDSNSGSRAQSLKNASDLLEKIALVSDGRWTCPLWNLARKADRSFTSGVFFYLVTFAETVPCPNGERLQLAGGLSDISAIMGRYPARDRAAARFASELQDIFYEFVIDGALPDNIRASQGLYEFGQTIMTRPNYPACAAWQ